MDSYQPTYATIERWSVFEFGPRVYSGNRLPSITALRESKAVDTLVTRQIIHISALTFSRLHPFDWNLSPRYQTAEFVTWSSNRYIKAMRFWQVSGEWCNFREIKGERTFLFRWLFLSTVVLKFLFLGNPMFPTSVQDTIGHRNWFLERPITRSTLIFGHLDASWQSWCFASQCSPERVVLISLWRSSKCLAHLQRNSS